MTRKLASRIRAVWRHYSTWALSAVLAIGSLWQFVPEVQEFLPRWVVAVIAIAGLVGKLIRQDRAPRLDAEQTARDYAAHRRMAGKSGGRVVDE